MSKPHTLRLARAEAVRAVLASRGNTPTTALYKACSWKFQMSKAQVNTAIDDLAAVGEVKLLATNWEIVVSPVVKEAKP